MPAQAENPTVSDSRGAGGGVNSQGARRGRLIALEGIDGAGKTTQARLLAEALGACHTFQFGATSVGEVIREVLLNPCNDGLDHRAEALLILADKAQHVAEVVLPALEAGDDVVSDRYTASTLAYQGYGRGLDLAELQRMADFATAGVQPDLNVLLDLNPAMRNRRLGASRDRLESAEAPTSPTQGALAAGTGTEEAGSNAAAGAAGVDAFVERVRTGYLEMAAQDPNRWVVVDAEGSVKAVAKRIQQAVRNHLKEQAQ